MFSSHHTLCFLGPEATLRAFHDAITMRPGDSRLLPQSHGGASAPWTAHQTLAWSSARAATCAQARARLLRPAPYPLALYEIFHDPETGTNTPSLRTVPQGTTLVEPARLWTALVPTLPDVVINDPTTMAHSLAHLWSKLVHAHGLSITADLVVHDDATATLMVSTHWQEQSTPTTCALLAHIDAHTLPEVTILSEVVEWYDDATDSTFGLRQPGDTQGVRPLPTHGRITLRNEEGAPYRPRYATRRDLRRAGVEETLIDRFTGTTHAQDWHDLVENRRAHAR